MGGGGVERDLSSFKSEILNINDVIIFIFLEALLTYLKMLQAQNPLQL